MLISIQHRVISQLNALTSLIKRYKDQVSNSESHLRYAREQERHESYDLKGF